MPKKTLKARVFSKMNETKLHRMIAGLEPWKDNYGLEMEYRGLDNVSWYDLSVNCNSIPCETDTAIIVTAWFGQLKWLKSTLTKYRESGAFVILAFDNPFYPWMLRDSSQMIRYMPNVNHYILANSIVHKHITYDGDKRNGWAWDVIYANGVLKNFPNIKYVYVTNGDCVIEKPEGLKKLKTLLGDNAVMAGQQNGEILHTASLFFERIAFDQFAEKLADKFKVPIIGSYSPERTLTEIIKDLRLKVKVAPKQPLDKDGTIDVYCCYGQDSTWREILGFRNLFAEYETAGNQGKDLYCLKDFVDDYMEWIYWSGSEIETICQYWKTGDRRYLFQFWDRWEDSWYNRLFYPLEHYGKDPIYGNHSGRSD